MTEFIVRRFNEAGVPDTDLCKVEAESDLQAAEKTCGIKLTDRPRPQMYLRADVRTAQRMNDHKLFYTAEG